MSNILLIEPDRVLGRVYATALSSVGWDVTVSHNAQDAIIMADNNRPDIVVCELHLVSHSGIEFLYEFRSYNDWQDVPVVIMSSVPLAEFAGSKRGLSVNLGVVEYLYKPNTSLRQLIRDVETILQSKTNETAKN